ADAPGREARCQAGAQTAARPETGRGGESSRRAPPQLAGAAQPQKQLGLTIYAPAGPTLATQPKGSLQMAAHHVDSNVWTRTHPALTNPTWGGWTGGVARRGSTGRSGSRPTARSSSSPSTPTVRCGPCRSPAPTARS